MIYLDHNATTPLLPEALERMRPFLGAPANASSVHRAGQRARAAVDEARDEVARALGCEARELVFTSGGTEADNLALRALVRPGEGRRLVVTAVEHPAVRETARALGRAGAGLVELSVDAQGGLSWDEVERAIVPGTALVSAMWANNETGVLFPVERLGLLCRERGVPFHVDAVQALGKVPIDLQRWPVDLLSVTAHKIGGPQGAGALFVRGGRTLGPLQTGGHQERGRRAGTENVAAIVGFGEAATRAEAGREAFAARAAVDGARLRARILRDIEGVRVTADGAPRLSTTLHLCVRDVEGEALLMALDLAGICASAGSACSSGSLEPSHVLVAMGLEPAWARGALRLSWGPSTTTAELDEAAAALAAIVPRLRASTRRG